MRLSKLCREEPGREPPGRPGWPAAGSRALPRRQKQPRGHKHRWQRQALEKLNTTRYLELSLDTHVLAVFPALDPRVEWPLVHSPFSQRRFFVHQEPLTSSGPGSRGAHRGPVRAASCGGHKSRSFKAPHSGAGSSHLPHPTGRGALPMSATWIHNAVLSARTQATADCLARR